MTEYEMKVLDAGIAYNDNKGLLIEAVISRREDIEYHFNILWADGSATKLYFDKPEYMPFDIDTTSPDCDEAPNAVHIMTEDEKKWLMETLQSPYTLNSLRMVEFEGRNLTVWEALLGITNHEYREYEDKRRVPEDLPIPDYTKLKTEGS